MLSSARSGNGKLGGVLAFFNRWHMAAADLFWRAALFRVASLGSASLRRLYASVPASPVGSCFPGRNSAFHDIEITNEILAARLAEDALHTDEEPVADT